nr:Gfo/Idh/MocA family oxidoreductase [Pseudohoeflea sp. DP4N28-3]
MIGCGEHATVVIHTSASLMPGIEVVAVCDLDAQRAASASRRFGSCPHFTDPAALLEKVDAEAAIIVAPPFVHAKLTRQCIEAGLHVFIEKPMFVTPDEVVAVEKAAAARPDLNVSVTFNKRYSPYVQEIKSIIGREDFGQPSYFFAKFAGGYRNGATDLLRVGAIHYFDLARYLFGPLARLSAISYEKQPGQAHIAVNVAFESGAVGNFFLSSLGLWSAKGAESMEIRGDRNFITLVNLRELTWQKPPLSVRGNASSHQSGVEIPAPAQYHEPNYSNISLLEYQSFHQNGYFPRLEAFVADIRAGTREGPGIDASRCALEAAMAVEQSINNNGAYVDL